MSQFTYDTRWKLLSWIRCELPAESLITSDLWMFSAWFVSTGFMVILVWLQLKFHIRIASIFHCAPCLTVKKCQLCDYFARSSPIDTFSCHASLTFDDLRPKKKKKKKKIRAAHVNFQTNRKSQGFLTLRQQPISQIRHFHQLRWPLTEFNFVNQWRRPSVSRARLVTGQII